MTFYYTLNDNFVFGLKWNKIDVIAILPKVHLKCFQIKWNGMYQKVPNKHRFIC